MIACLLPARDCVADLPGYLDSAAGFADAVVALDDGSTDGTADALARSELVPVLIRNPPRHGHAGWDDRANRQRLLEAAAEVEPDWVVFLDSDERIDADDAALLRRFLGSDALPACAYGFPLYRGWGGDRVVARPTWVYRSFAYGSGLELPGPRLHFNPVPAGVRREAWIRTTIRLRHLDSPERLAARRRKYEQADPDGRLAPLRDPLMEAPDPALLRDWTPRPPHLEPLDAEGVVAEVEGPAARRRLACLVPARNCEDDVAGYLESAARFADGVIALDDGSTDGTGAALERSALVERVLANPRRDTYEGWDDRANRQRLLEAAAEGGFDWAFFLDADERVDAEDALALRELVERAEPGCAYGFRVHRMIGDTRHYDRADLWAYRLFEPGPGQALPEGRLHFVPIPESIRRECWRRTTVRIQHLAGLDEARRRARVRKYEEADPGRRWQGDYGELAAPPENVREWRPRPVGMPLLTDPLGRGAGGELDLDALDLEAPVLSAIVIARDDAETIARTLDSVVGQRCDERLEVIVVVSGSRRTAEAVRERFDEVTLVELPEPALPGAARNAGLMAASGEYVSFPGSHIELPPGSLAARVRAHEQGHAMVTGSVINGTTTRAGWASYFIDHSTALPGRPSGPLGGAPAHCSYVREHVLAVGGFPADLRAGEDTVVNQELVRRGLRAFRAQEVTLIHRSRCARPLRLVSHHFQRGRALARVLRGDHRGGSRRPRRHAIAIVRGLFRRRLSETDFRVARWGGALEAEYARARPLVVAGLLAAWAGAWLEVLRPGRRGRGSSGAQ